MKKFFLKLLPYAIVFLIAFSLLGSWFVGGNAKSWASSQNRAAYTFPELKLSSPINQLFFQDVDRFLSDSLAVKLPLISGVNLAVLSTLGMPLNGAALVGTPVPEFFPTDPLGTQLYYADDFTLPCKANFDAINTSLDAFNKVIESSTVTTKVLIAPNKSTVPAESLSPWQEWLLKCSSQGRNVLQKYSEQYSEIVVIEPLNSSFANASETYWSGDTHWKPTTAEAILPYFAEGEDYSHSNWQNLPFEKRQDLLAFLSIVDEQSEVSITPLASQFEVTTNTLKSGGILTKIVNTTSSAEMKTGIVVFDSFIGASDLIPKIASQYRTTYF